MRPASPFFLGIALAAQALWRFHWNFSVGFPIALKHALGPSCVQQLGGAGDCVCSWAGSLAELPAWRGGSGRVQQPGPAAGLAGRAPRLSGVLCRALGRPDRCSVSPATWGPRLCWTAA